MVDIYQLFQKQSSVFPQVVQLRRNRPRKMAKMEKFSLPGHISILSIFGMALLGTQLSQGKCLYMKLKLKTSSNRCELHFLPSHLGNMIFLPPNIGKSRNAASLNIAVNSLFQQISGNFFPIYDMIISYLADFRKYIHISEYKNISVWTLDSIVRGSVGYGKQQISNI